MSKRLKWILITLGILLGIDAVGYWGYRLYNYLIEDANRKIRKGVKKEIGKSLNPFEWKSNN